jgi:hypothetical protein
MTKWRLVSPKGLQTVLRLALLLDSASSSDHLTVTFRFERRIYSLGKCRYITVFLSGVRSTSDIKRESILQSLLLVPSIYILICLSNINLIKISIKSCYTSLELGLAPVVAPSQSRVPIYFSSRIRYR